MGAYLVLYPKARVHTLFIIIIIIRVFPLPAWFFLLYWFSLQLASSSYGAAREVGEGWPSGPISGVSWPGSLLVKLFQNQVLVGRSDPGFR